MRRLSREGVCCPENWRAHLRKRSRFDLDVFEAAAQAFERLPLDSSERRAGFEGWPEAQGALQRSKRGQAFPAVWSRAKAVLADMTIKKCSYCESSLAGQRLGQVDHFKPKALFPALAYDWDNYFLACGRCNGAKWNKWPAAGPYLRPDEGDPASELIFSEDGTVRAARLGAAAEQTIRDLDLNEAWLVEARRRRIAFVLEGTSDLFAELPEGLARRLALRSLHRLRAQIDLDFYVAINQCCERLIEKGRRTDPPRTAL